MSARTDDNTGSLGQEDNNLMIYLRSQECKAQCLLPGTTAQTSPCIPDHLHKQRTGQGARVIYLRLLL